jgi:hypothetical protein
LLAVLAVAATVVSAGSGAGQSDRAALKPTIYILYAMDCTFTIVDDNGKTVTSIAPGNYQVDVRTPVIFGAVPLSAYGLTDMTACKGFPQFQLTGPGVNLSTTMTAGCQQDLTFLETFQANSTYTAVDNNQPTVARGTFTTLAGGAPQTPTTTLGATTSRGESQSSLIGSKSVTFRGTLKASLSAKGVSTLLTAKGKPVSKLQSGQYTFAIKDLDSKSGFSLLAPKAKVSRSLSGIKFVGPRKVTLSLKAGTWMYLSSGMRQMHVFTVSK